MVYYKVSRKIDSIAVSNHYGIMGARKSRDSHKGYHIYKVRTDVMIGGKTVWEKVE